jgi:hypothetical protein
MDFRDNISNAANSQGNIALNNGAVMTMTGIVNMIAQRNKAASGGFLYVPANVGFTFSGQTLEMTSNTAFGVSGSGYGRGGAFYFYGTGLINFAGTNMNFFENTAKLGAVLYASGAGRDITFGGTNASALFQSNFTQEGRGVISWDSGALVRFNGLSRLTAKWNRSAGGGGFLNIVDASYILDSTNIDISSNGAINVAGAYAAGNISGNGGAIYLLNSSVTFRATGGSIIISTNIAQNGGGMFLTQSYAGFTTNLMKFSSNVATAAGGGMYFENVSTAAFAASTMGYYGNTANNGNGGAIYFTKSYANFSPGSMTFTLNKANGSGRGGGL